MNSDLARTAVVLGLVVWLGGCATNAITEAPGDLRFGDANRQTMMAQVINPDPVYTEPAQTSGAHAADAVERYRTDKVKQPDTIRTTTNTSSSQPDSN
jgi:hypothetical protein